MHIKIYEKRPAKITRPPLFIKIYYYFVMCLINVLTIAAVAPFDNSLYGLSINAVPAISKCTHFLAFVKLDKNLAARTINTVGRCLPKG